MTERSPPACASASDRVGVRRRCLTITLAAAAAAFPVAAAIDEHPPGLALSGDVSPVHDPSIVRAGKTYYVFSTGHQGQPGGIVPVRTSEDLQHWQLRGAVFAAVPAWASEAVAGARGVWAPDISFRNGEYRLYYSVSTFGQNRSVIGLAVNPRLDPETPSAGWTDKGKVIESGSGDDFNAIDPNAFDDGQGREWLVFGSFWSGIRMIRLDPATGLRLAGDMNVLALARRPRPDAIEAPFLIRHGDYYYLFASFDFCCRGAKSNYYTMVGRSKDVTGPYVDREGKKMMEGGGFIVLHAQLDPTKRFVGPGHSAVLSDGGRDYIVYHAYDTKADGAPTLRIQRLGWSADGWPVAV
jgi:arabinan endo-1,5-alpha-L-arabinosidase